MTILQANLKHLYQKRGLIVWALLSMLPICAFSIGIISEYNSGVITLFTTIIFAVGVILACLPFEVLTKPFAYLLPGHRAVPRKFLFITCTATCAIETVVAVILGIKYGSLVVSSPVVVAIFMAASAAFWLGAWLVFKKPLMGASFAGLTIFIFMAFYFFGGVTSIERFVVMHWPFVILVGLFANARAWFYFGDYDLPRRYCDTIWIGAPLDSWNLSTEQKAKRTKAFLDKKEKQTELILPQVESFFLKRMSKAEPNSLSLYVLGGFYQSHGMLFSNIIKGRIRFIIFVLVISVIAGFLHTFGVFAGLILSVPSVECTYRKANLLLMGGRIDRFRASLIRYIITFCSRIISLLILCLLTMLIEHLFPDFTILGRTYIGFNIVAPLSLLIVLFPFFAITGLVSFIKQAVIWIVFFILLSLSHNVLMPCFKEPIYLLLFVIACMFLTWGLFLTVLWHNCMRRDLV